MTDRTKRAGRRRDATGLLLLATLAFLLSAAAAVRAEKPVATFSVVGFDPETGDLGVAVQSRFFAVGSVVPWAKAGVGAIATQAFANTSYGPRGLRLLEQGLPVHETLDLLLASDDGREQRQVGIIDAHGNAASFTGTGCQAWAGGRTGKNFAVQGNILVSEETVAAMARAFEETKGMLGDRLLRAIEEGQRAGGDSRGVESAALLIVREGAGYAGFNDRYCDLRVDDSPDPIGELRRLYEMWKEQALILEGYRLCDKEDWEGAFRAGREAVAENPEKGEPHYHLACYLSRAGRAEEALTELGRAVSLDPALGPRAGGDPDFEPLRSREDFQTIVRGKG